MPQTTSSAPPRDDRFDTTVGRLVELSVGQGHDAYEDVPWDDPRFAVDPSDPRLRLFSFDPLARTDWYRGLPLEEQARVGLQRTAVNMRIGWEFENLLQQGLLARALRMGNEETAFTYVHHEVMEESQHTLMFYEFVRRYAPGVHGMPRALLAFGDPFTNGVCRRFPALFYFMVLGGEIPIDHLQRLAVQEEHIHPLVERIMSIHVEEEARHVSYANQELRRRVPAMTRVRRLALSVAVPAVLAVMARLMVHPSRWLVAANDVPEDDVRAALHDPASRRLLADSVGRIRRLCEELELMTVPARRAWRAAGLVPPA